MQSAADRQIQLYILVVLSESFDLAGGTARGSKKRARNHKWTTRVFSLGFAGFRRGEEANARGLFRRSGLVSSIHEPCHPPNRSSRRVLQVWAVGFSEQRSSALKMRQKHTVNRNTHLQTTSDRNSVDTSAFGRSLGVRICARNFKVRSR